MPIDSPYNRKVAAEFNKMNRAKVSYLDHTLQDVIETPIGKFAVPSFTGDNMMMGVNRTVGGGMGSYIKGGAKPCPKGHAVCKCGGNNAGVNPKTRMELALGAGHMNGSVPDHLVPNTSAGNPSMTSNTNAHLSGGVKPKESGMRGNSAAGKKAGNKRDELMSYNVSDSYVVKGGKHNQVVAHADKEYYGGSSDGRKARAEIVKKVMAEKGLKMIEASKYVKEHNLYKK